MFYQIAFSSHFKTKSLNYIAFIVTYCSILYFLNNTYNKVQGDK